MNANPNAVCGKFPQAKWTPKQSLWTQTQHLIKWQIQCCLQEQTKHDSIRYFSVGLYHWVTFYWGDSYRKSFHLVKTICFSCKLQRPKGTWKRETYCRILCVLIPCMSELVPGMLRVNDAMRCYSVAGVEARRWAHLEGGWTTDRSYIYYCNLRAWHEIKNLPLICPLTSA